MIDSLLSRGIPTVIAAGNNYLNGKVGAPGCISSAVTVGSTTKDDDVSDFSNHARMVDLMAPGSDITAPVADGDRGATGVKSGTSMAAPHVAGAWALDGVDGISGRGGPARLLCRNDRTRAIRAGEFNTLKVISEDGRHRFFINNREVCGADEASHTTGNVAVMMGADGPEHIYQVNRIHARTLDDGASAAAAAAAGAEAYGRAAPGAALAVVTGAGALAAALGRGAAAGD